MKKLVYLFLVIFTFSACGQGPSALNPKDEPLDPLEGKETSGSVISEYKQDGYDILLFEGPPKNEGFLATIEINYPNGKWESFNNLSFCSEEIECSVDFQDDKYVVVRRSVGDGDTEVTSDIYFNIETKKKVFSFAESSEYEVEIMPGSAVNVEEVKVLDKKSGKTSLMDIDLQCEDIKNMINITCLTDGFSDDGNYLRVNHVFMNFTELLDLKNLKSVLRVMSDKDPIMAQWEGNKFVMCYNLEKNEYANEKRAGVLVVSSGVRKDLYLSEGEGYAPVQSCEVNGESLDYVAGEEEKSFDLSTL